MKNLWNKINKAINLVTEAVASIIASIFWGYVFVCVALGIGSFFVVVSVTVVRILKVIFETL